MIFKLLHIVLIPIKLLRWPSDFLVLANCDTIKGLKKVFTNKKGIDEFPLLHYFKYSLGKFLLIFQLKQ
mgnify:CR=1 FL=1